jgi:hypothetical protein
MRQAVREGQANTAAAEKSTPGTPANLSGRINALAGSFENYNPQQAVNTYAQGAWGSISEALKQNLAAEEGAAVGAGRLNTGFYDQDRGEIYGRATGQLTNAIAQQSLGAEGLRLRGMEDSGDLLTSQYESAENDRREEEQRKRKNRSGLAGAIGTGLGYLAGGPVGGYVGGGIAGAIFN